MVQRNHADISASKLWRASRFCQGMPYSQCKAYAYVALCGITCDEMMRSHAVLLSFELKTLNRCVKSGVCHEPACLWARHSADRALTLWCDKRKQRQCGAV